MTGFNTLIVRFSATALVGLFLLLWGCHSAASVTADPFDRHPAHLILTRHARCRMDCRHITEKQIRQVLEKGEINYKKSETEDNTDPRYALEGYTNDGQHLRVIFAPSDHGLVVVTCIELGVEWRCDCP